jgi:murein DD-endopeptidase
MTQVNINIQPIRKIIICFLVLLFYFVSGQKAFADVNNDTVNRDESDSQIIKEPAKSNDLINDMLLQATDLIGIPYRWGGDTPQSGMDCSGLIRYVFKKSLGITLPRTAAEMFRVGKPINLKEIEPGDLLFFHTARGSSRISHIGMYIGNNQFIQSPRTGTKIQISDLNQYWHSRMIGAKRIVQENIDDDGNITFEKYQNLNDKKLPKNNGSSNPHHKRTHKKRSHT